MYRDELGNVVGVLGMSRDVTLRVAADEAIRLRNRAIESSQDAVVITSRLLPGNPVVYVNPAFERITGFSSDETIDGGIGRLLKRDGQPESPELLVAMQENSEGRAVLQKIQDVLGEPVMLGTEAFSVTCSIGVSIFPQHGDDADTLLKNADAAMYLAKKNGRNNIVFYAGDGAAARTGGGPSSNGL